MRTVIIEQGQSIEDIALQYCGDNEACSEICTLNNLSIIDELQPGMEIKLPEPYNKAVANYFEKLKFKPASNIKVIDSGIGSMKIGSNFIIK